jgi:cellulose biosynthesis protein BcsQ
VETFATYNIKGGVGKTSAAVNLAALAAADGHRTLLWDLDPQSAASYLLRVKAKVKGGGKALVSGKRPLEDAVKATEVAGLDLIPGDETYRNLDLLLDAAKKPTTRVARLLAPLAGNYDVVFLDCPPGISLVGENVLRAAGTVLVPMIPTTLSVRTLEQLETFAADLDHKPGLLAFFNLVDRRKKLHREIMEQLGGDRTDVATAAIPALSEIEQMAVHRSPLAVSNPGGRAAKAYAALWAEIGRRTGTRAGNRTRAKTRARHR